MFILQTYELKKVTNIKAFLNIRNFKTRPFDKWSVPYDRALQNTDLCKK